MTSAIQRVAIAGRATQSGLTGYVWSWTRLIVKDSDQPGAMSHRSRTVTVHLRAARSQVIEIIVEDRDLRAAAPAVTAGSLSASHLIPVRASWIADGRHQHLEVREASSEEMLLTASVEECGRLLYVRSILPARYGVAPVHADPARGDPVFERD